MFLFNTSVLRFRAMTLHPGFSEGDYIATPRTIKMAEVEFLCTELENDFMKYDLYLLAQASVLDIRYVFNPLSCGRVGNSDLF